MISQGPYDRGVEWPVVVIGSIAAVFLALGVLPPYPELWKRRGRVVGISKWVPSDVYLPILLAYVLYV